MSRLTTAKLVQYILCPGLCFLVMTAGCSDPSTLGRFRATPVTNIILESIGVVDEEPEKFVGARDPQIRDLQISEEEYVIHSGDVLAVSILELFASGSEWRDVKQVNETGRITFPVLGPVQASGRTEQELTEDIINKLSPHIIKDPKVNVVVTNPTAKTYSIDGMIPGRGAYSLSKPDFRILEALAQAGGVPERGADFAYVVRRASLDDLAQISSRRPEDSEQYDQGVFEPVMLPTDPRQLNQGRPRSRFERRRLLESPEGVPGSRAESIDGFEESQEQVDEERVPLREDQTPEDELLKSITPMSVIIRLVDVSEPEEYIQEIPSAADILSDSDIASLAEDEQLLVSEGKILKVIRKHGRFMIVPAQEGLPEETPSLYPQEPTPPELVAPPERVLPRYEKKPTPRERAPSREMEDEGLGDLAFAQEVIRIDLKKLANGDRRQNIVIRAGDYIMVPRNSGGIFHVMGQVPRPGPYTIMADRMTLKQAIATVAGLTPLAAPERCDLIRRIGRNKEVTYRINLKKLFEGTQPDYFLKANDLINVGSHPVARWVAVIRQSFRSTYGFGFVYDRNMADKDFGR